MKTTLQLPTGAAIQARFDAASTAGVSPCCWIPEPWDSLPTDDQDRRILRDTSADAGSFDNTVPPEVRIARGEAKDGQPLDTPETPPNDFQWVHPFGNFDHVDDSEFSSKDISTIASALDPGKHYPRFKALGDLLQEKRPHVINQLGEPEGQRFDLIVSVLQGTASLGSPPLTEIATDLKDGPIFSAIVNVIQKEPKAEKAFTQVRELLNPAEPQGEDLTRFNALNRLRRIVGEASPGMQRLGRVFEWALYRTTELLGQINVAVKDQNKARYEDLRKHYLELLRDLDDHEPPHGNQRLDPRKKDYKDFASGYGRCIKWACLEPHIFKGKIVGARVVIQWNPHSSSNGVPIEHP